MKTPPDGELFLLRRGYYLYNEAMLYAMDSKLLTMSSISEDFFIL